MDVSEVFNKKQAYPFYYVINKTGEFIYVDQPNKLSQITNIKRVIKKALKE